MDNGVLANRPQDLASHLDTIMNMVVSLFQRVDAQVGVIPHPDEASSTNQPLQWEKRKATTQDVPVHDFPIDQGVRQKLEESLRRAPLPVVYY